MPHTRSAKKNLRKSQKRRLYNRTVKKGIRLQVRAFQEALTAGNTEQANAEFRKAVKKLDKAGARRTIHPNKAARKKSQLARLLNEAKKKASASPTPQS